MIAGERGRGTGLGSLVCRPAARTKAPGLMSSITTNESIHLSVAPSIYIHVVDADTRPRMIFGQTALSDMFRRCSAPARQFPIGRTKVYAEDVVFVLQ